MPSSRSRFELPVGIRGEEPPSSSVQNNPQLWQGCKGYWRKIRFWPLTEQGAGALTENRRYQRPPPSQLQRSSKPVFSLQTPYPSLVPPPLRLTIRYLGPGGAGAGRQENWTVTGVPLRQSPDRNPSPSPLCSRQSQAALSFKCAEGRGSPPRRQLPRRCSLSA